MQKPLGEASSDAGITKAALLARLRIGRVEWEYLLALVGEINMTLPNVVGNWSVRDVIAHVLAHEQFVCDRLEEAARDEAYKPSQNRSELSAFLKRYGIPDFGSPLIDQDGPNAWVVAHSRRVPLRTLLAKEKKIFHRLVQQVEALSDAQLSTNSLWRQVLSKTTEHYATHRDDIRIWVDVLRD